MRRMIILLLFSLSLYSQDKADFHSYEIVLKSKEKLSLSAWQIELTYDKNKNKITALEGGEEPFKEPADYDARGLTAGKIILAAFTLKKNQDKNEYLVARVHFYGSKENKPEVKLVIAADTKGQKRKIEVLLRDVKKNE